MKLADGEMTRFPDANVKVESACDFKGSPFIGSEERLSEIEGVIGKSTKIDPLSPDDFKHKWPWRMGASQPDFPHIASTL